MDNKKIAAQAVSALKRQYPNATCSLNYAEPLHLLIATRLAAQCTDKRVNMVTPALFERYPRVQDFASAHPEDIEPYIKSCGLYKTKAADIVNMSRMLVEYFDGEVPDSIEDLTKLPGVGRKTANLIVGDVFGKPSYVVDTHCIRITGRLGFHDPGVRDANKIEKILRELIEPKESGDFCHRLVLHGRETCKPRNPSCGSCCMKNFCKKLF